MLGLKRGTVALAEPDAGWTEAYTQAAVEIVNALGRLGAEIEHVGSTAVPGLVAKPILDIAVGVRDPINTERIVTRLVGIGYLDLGVGEGAIGRLLVRESAPNVRTVHVHILYLDGNAWSYYIKFRDALRRDSRLRDQYAELKRTLAQRFAADREAYTEGKADFVRTVVDSSATDPGRHQVL